MPGHTAVCVREMGTGVPEGHFSAASLLAEHCTPAVRAYKSDQFLDILVDFHGNF